MLDLHQHASILGIGFGLFHTVILLGDGYSNYTLKQLLVPFASSQYKPLWIGLGQLGLYGLALVTVSFGSNVGLAVALGGRFTTPVLAYFNGFGSWHFQRH